MLSQFTYCCAECHYAECHYAACHGCYLEQKYFIALILCDLLSIYVKTNVSQVFHSRIKLKPKLG